MSSKEDESKEAKKKLKKLMAREGNDQCADCFEENPRYASVNLGVFICDDCYGAHRSLGTHISRTKSVKLDKWTLDEVKAMMRGNIKVNADYEATMPAKAKRTSDEYESRDQLNHFIKQKYDKKKWYSNQKEAEARRRRDEEARRKAEESEETETESESEDDERAELMGESLETGEPYEVQDGDTVKSIAKAWKVSEDELRRTNRLSKKEHLWEGQMIYVPEIAMIDNEDSSLTGIREGVKEPKNKPEVGVGQEHIRVKFDEYGPIGLNLGIRPKEKWNEQIIVCGEAGCTDPVRANSPAGKVGLKLGDSIVAVQGKKVIWMNLQEVKDTIAGCKERPMWVDFLRFTHDPFNGMPKVGEMSYSSGPLKNVSMVSHKYAAGNIGELGREKKIGQIGPKKPIQRGRGGGSIGELKKKKKPISKPQSDSSDDSLSDSEDDEVREERRIGELSSKSPKSSKKAAEKKKKSKKKVDSEESDESEPESEEERYDSRKRIGELNPKSKAKPKEAEKKKKSKKKVESEPESEEEDDDSEDEAYRRKQEKKKKEKARQEKEAKKAKEAKKKKKKAQDSDDEDSDEFGDMVGAGDTNMEDLLGAEMPVQSDRLEDLLGVEENLLGDTMVNPGQSPPQQQPMQNMGGMQQMMPPMYGMQQQQQPSMANYTNMQIAPVGFQYQQQQIGMQQMGMMQGGMQQSAMSGRIGAHLTPTPEAPPTQEEKNSAAFSSLVDLA